MDLKRHVVMIKNQSGDVIAFTNVKDISTLVDQAKREESYIRALATEYDSIAIVDSKKLELMTRFVHPDDQEQFTANTKRIKVFESFANNKTHVVDFRIIKSDKTYLFYQLRFVAIKDDDGIPVGTIACMRNIDAEKVLNSLKKVKMSSKHLLTLVNDVLDMSRMNGYDATKAIRELPNPYAANIPIIAMTANAFAEDIKNAFDAKMNAHIAKPIDVPKLLDILSKIIK